MGGALVIRSFGKMIQSPSLFGGALLIRGLGAYRFFVDVENYEAANNFSC